MEELTSGHNEAMRRSEKVSSKDVEHTMEWLSQEVNTAAASLQEKSEAENRETLAKFCNGDINLDDLAANWKDAPKQVKSKCFQHMAKKFTRKQGYTKQKTNTSGHERDLRPLKGKGRWYIHRNDHASHFMTSTSTLVFYESLLKDSFDAQRERHSLTGRVGLLVADAFTGNFATREGIQMCLRNWERLPEALFAKAWYETGHVEKADILAKGRITEEDWDNCKLLPDPASLNDVIGAENAAEPALADLIANGQAKRQRVLWFIQEKHPSHEMALLPGTLVFPVEKRLANYLFASTQPGQTPNKFSTITFSCRNGREASWQLLQKHTFVEPNGQRRFKSSAAAVTAFLQEEGQKAFYRKLEMIESAGPGLTAMVTRQVLLMQLDTFWQQHLKNMDFMKSGPQSRVKNRSKPGQGLKARGVGDFRMVLGSG
eukprot:Skav202231  [mRNA]  locus=scaffold2988:97814:110466:+ [translate_table: standard]